MTGGYFADPLTPAALLQLAERVGKLEQLMQERRFDSRIDGTQNGITYGAQLQQAYTNNSTRVSQLHFIKRDGRIQLDYQLYPGTTGHAVDLVTGVPLEFRPVSDLRFQSGASTFPAAGAAGWEHEIQMRTDGAIRNLSYGTTPTGITDTSGYIIGTITYFARL